jgi:hypothetical protein
MRRSATSGPHAIRHTGDGCATRPRVGEWSPRRADRQGGGDLHV